MAQWVRNLTAVAQVAGEVWVQSLISLSELTIRHYRKLQCRLQMQPGYGIAVAVVQASSCSSHSTPSSRNFHMPQMWP